MTFQDWGASFKFPRNKVIARELLRLQKRNMRSCRDILRPRTCQCRGCTLLQQKSSSSCSTATWDMVVHGQEHDFDFQDWNDAYGGLKNIIWTLNSVLDLHMHLFVFAKFRSTCAAIEDKKQDRTATKLSATLRWSIILNSSFSNMWSMIEWAA